MSDAGRILTDALRLILGQGMLLAAIGLAIGCGGIHLLKTLLYGVIAADSLTFAVVTRLFGSVTLLAC